MSKNILLTGGTGLVGSNLAYRLLKRGDRVFFLTRAKKDISLYNRIEESIRVVDSDFDISKYDFEILEADITKPRCGISDEKIMELHGRIDELWHCAASMSFDELDLQLNNQVNVEGVRNVIALAQDIGMPIIHYLSTAYVAGLYEGVFLEIDHDKGQGFKNIYEKTKFDSELLIRTYKGKSIVYRLSIVVGDSVTGRTLTFTGYYRFFSPLYILHKKIAGRINNGKQDFYKNTGISLTNNGTGLVLPVIVPISASSTLNLINIDWAVEIMIRLSGKKHAIGKTFHIVHDNPPGVRDVIGDFWHFMGIDGIRAEDPQVYEKMNGKWNLIHMNQTIRNIQRLVHRQLEAYFPYTRSEAKFDNSNVRQVLAEEYIPSPLMTRDNVKILVDYALKQGFRR